MLVWGDEMASNVCVFVCQSHYFISSIPVPLVELTFGQFHLLVEVFENSFGEVAVAQVILFEHILLLFGHPGAPPQRPLPFFILFSLSQKQNFAHLFIEVHSVII